jgi:hypothetical protein
MQREQHWPPRTSEVLVLLLGEQPLGASAVEWATSALAEGFDSPALRSLAGLDLEQVARTAEAKPLVEAALRQIGVSDLSFEEAARRYLREVALAVVHGQLEPRLAADLVHSRVVSPLHHPKDLMAWCYVWEGNAADCSRQLEPAEEDAEIMSVARHFAQAAV